ncbi:MAG: hypothetical protein ACJ8LM_08880, partial [Candidatus Udaeobacter sp.]
MESANDRPQISLKPGLSPWLMNVAVPFIVVLGVTAGVSQSNSFAANPSVRKTERNVSVEADDQTFSPTAKITASVGKGGKNEMQDVLLVKRLLSKFGYELTLNGEAGA